MESYGYNNEDIIIKWDSEDPIHVMEDMEPPSYSLTKTTTENITIVSGIGEFAGCGTKFSFADGAAKCIEVYSTGGLLEAIPSNPGDTLAADGRALWVEIIWERLSERG